MRIPIFVDRFFQPSIYEPVRESRATQPAEFEPKLVICLYSTTAVSNPLF